MIDQLGDYHILDAIGEGAFAEVFRARSERTGATVALKVLNPILLRDERMVRQFLKEGAILKSLDHPNIIKIHEVTQIEGRLLLVMDLVEGSSGKADLSAYIQRKGRISWPETLAILASICDALDYAHSRGVIHRDIKPANILLDADCSVRLTDFGLARLIDDDTTSFSLTRSTAGTPAYIAPEIWEQANTGEKGYSIASDVYALGCITFEMLLGQPLFSGTPLQIMRQHDIGPTFPTRWPSDVPPSVEAVLARALARYPSDRYPSTGSFLVALRVLSLSAQPRPQVAAPAQPQGPNSMLAPALEPDPEASAAAAVAMPDSTATGPLSARRTTNWLPFGGAAAVVLALVLALNLALGSRGQAEQLAGGQTSIATPGGIVWPQSSPESSRSSLQSTEASTRVTATAESSTATVSPAGDTARTAMALTTTAAAATTTEAVAARATADAKQASQATPIPQAEVAPTATAAASATPQLPVYQLSFVEISKEAMIAAEGSVNYSSCASQEDPPSCNLYIIAPPEVGITHKKASRPGIQTFRMNGWTSVRLTFEPELTTFGVALTNPDNFFYGYDVEARGDTVVNIEAGKFYKLTVTQVQ